MIIGGAGHLAEVRVRRAGCEYLLTLLKTDTNKNQVGGVASRYHDKSPNTVLYLIGYLRQTLLSVPLCTTAQPRGGTLAIFVDVPSIDTV